MRVGLPLICTDLKVGPEQGGQYGSICARKAVSCVCSTGTWWHPDVRRVLLPHTALLEVNSEGNPGRRKGLLSLDETSENGAWVRFQFLSLIQARCACSFQEENKDGFFSSFYWCTSMGIVCTFRD